ncbi:hypothetical protein PGT21_021695 [Puccinia graminis f. sp. tritici]|uniref:Uncharacterized protein n=1 Tax=Puccinia graminis f. sp. tritici TaxID=56615 RepID=A0A5B0M0S3_PUCGR|nr:hypothetical protein PGT21_021695 [Puccinia graminis f. sp. tritici]KAA1125765.1 hypothetical protein PGTUg99_016304 [Puccinia graminis f. sp. tritici]
MRNSRPLYLTLIIICGLQMCSFQAVEPCEDLVLPNASPDSAPKLAEKEIVHGRDDPSEIAPSRGQEESVGIFKRPGTDMINSHSYPSSLEALRAQAIALKDRKKPGLSDIENNTIACYEKTMTNFHDWKTGFSKWSLPKEELVEVQQKLQEAEDALMNLFSRRLRELSGQLDQFKAIGTIPSENHVPSDYVTWMDSILEIEETWELTELDDKEEAVPFIRQGSNLIIDFFIDLQKLEIIPKEDLSDYLNKEDGARMISSYAYNGFRQSRLDVCKLYMNFNVKLSLLEGPATKKVANLLKLLDNDAWRRTEFEYLCAQVWQYSKDPSTKTHAENWEESIRPFFDDFKNLASQKYIAELSVEKVQEFIQEAMTQLKVVINEDEAARFAIETKSLIETKLIYDMISFIMRYHQDILTTIKDNNQGKRFYIDLCAIERSVGFLSDVYHSIYVRAREYQSSLDHVPWKPDFLVDNNENRQIPLFPVWNYPVGSDRVWKGKCTVNKAALR